MERTVHHIAVLALALLIATVFTTDSAYATAYVWSDIGGGDWTSTANWNPNGDPNSAADTVEFANLGQAYTVTLGDIRTIGGVTLSGTDPALNISGTLIQSGGASTYSGGLLTGTGTMRWENGAAVTWSSATAPLGDLNFLVPAGNTVSLDNSLGNWQLGSGQSLKITGQTTVASDLTISDGFSSSGLIQIGQFNQYGLHTITVTNGTLTNNLAGNIAMYPRSETNLSWSMRTLSAELHNDGVFTNYTPNGYLGRAGADHVNTGTFKMDSSLIAGGGGTAYLRVSGSSFTNSGVLDTNDGILELSVGAINLNSGGTIAGNGVLVLGGSSTDPVVAWDMTDPTQALTYRIGGTSKVTLNRTSAWTIQDGQTLHLDRGAVQTAPQLTLNQDLNNSGLIQIGRPDGDHPAEATITVASTNGRLTNSATGEIFLYPRSATSVTGPWSRRQIKAELINYGAMNVSTGYGFLGTIGDDHVNYGTVTIDSSALDPGNSAALFVTGNSLTNTVDGVIAGTGDLNLTNVTGQTLGNSGTLRPGASIGTLDLIGNLNMTADSILDYEFDAAGNSDLITVSGDLVLNGTIMMGGNFIPGQTYTIFTVGGNFIDNGLSLANLPGYRAEITQDGTAIQFMAIPEPTTALLLTFGALLALRRRRG